MVAPRPRSPGELDRTRTTTWTGSGRPCCCTSSTTSCRAARSRWVHREAEATYARLAVELEAIIDDGPAGAGRRGSTRSVVFNAAPHGRDGVPALGAAVAAGARRQAGDGERGRPHRAGQRPRSGSPSTSAACSPRSYDVEPQREAIAPGAAGNLLQLHVDTPEPVGRLGRRPVLPQQRHRPDRRRQRRGRQRHAGGGRDRGRDAVLRPVHASTQTLRVRAGREAGRHRDTRSTGTRRRSSSRRRSRSTCTPTGRRRRRSSATSSGRPTRTPRGRRRSSRSARTAGCTSASRATASPSSTTRPTATTSPATVRDDGGTTTTVRLSLLRAPRFPDPETDQGVHTAERTRWCPAPAIADAVEEGYRINLPARVGHRRRGRRAAGRGRQPGVVVEAVKLADDRVRRRGRPAVRVARRPGRGARLTPSFDGRRRWRRPTCSSGRCPTGSTASAPSRLPRPARSTWRCGRSRS